MGRLFLICTALQTLLAGVLCFIPLFNLLGYEFAEATCLLAAVTSLLLGLRAARVALGWRPALLLAWGSALLHLAPGLLLISLNAFRVRNCDYGEGLLFWLLLPAATALYGATLGWAVGRVVPAPLRGAATVLLLLYPLLAGVMWIYTQPAIFAYDHLWGYVSGSIYDEALTLSGPLLALRVMTLLRIGVLVVAVVTWERRLWLGGARLAAAVALGVVLIAADRWAGPRWGYRVSREDIEAALPVVVRREGIVIRLPATTSPEDAAAVADDHAFRLAQLQRTLNLPQPPNPPLTSYIYADRAQKARLMGAGNTQIAKPWLREIHLNDVRPDHPVLAHELVHVLAQAFGDPVLGISRTGLIPNMTLVEGLAVAITAPHGPRDLHHEVQAMRQVGLAPDLNTLLAPGGFWGQAPQRAYTVAGSFVRYLIDSRGVEALKAAYPTGDLAAAYGVPLRELIGEWEAMLNQLPLSPRDQEEARSRFHAPSIFYKPCAHVIANLQAEAARAQAPEAVALREKIAELLGHPPSAQIDLARALYQAGELARLWPITEALLLDPALTTYQREEVHNLRGQVAWREGKLQVARKDFAAALALQRSLPSERLHWVRLWALDRPPQEAAFLRVFLEGKLPKLPAGLELLRLTHKHPQEPTYPYLLARQLEAQGAYTAALTYLRRAGTHPFVPIEAERRRMMAELHLRAGDWNDARREYRAYANIVPLSGERARALDQLQRVTFLEAHGITRAPRDPWTSRWEGVEPSEQEQAEPLVPPEGPAPPEDGVPYPQDPDLPQ